MKDFKEESFEVLLKDSGFLFKESDLPAEYFHLIEILDSCRKIVSILGGRGIVSTKDIETVDDEILHICYHASSSKIMKTTVANGYTAANPDEEII